MTNMKLKYKTVKDGVETDAEIEIPRATGTNPGLTDNNFTNALKQKVDNLPENVDEELNKKINKTIANGNILQGFIEGDIRPVQNETGLKIQKRKLNLQTGEIISFDLPIGSSDNSVDISYQESETGGNIDIKAVGSGAVWSQITGNIDDQEDLKEKLDEKVEKEIVGGTSTNSILNTADYIEFQSVSNDDPTGKGVYFGMDLNNFSVNYIDVQTNKYSSFGMDESGINFKVWNVGISAIDFSNNPYMPTEDKNLTTKKYVDQKNAELQTNINKKLNANHTEGGYNFNITNGGANGFEVFTTAEVDNKYYMADFRVAPDQNILLEKESYEDYVLTHHSKITMRDNGISISSKDPIRVMDYEGQAYIPNADNEITSKKYVDQKNAELQANIDNEQETREQADTTLQANIDEIKDTFATTTNDGQQTKENFAQVLQNTQDIAGLKSMGGKYIGFSFDTYQDLLIYNTGGDFTNINQNDYCYVRDDEEHDDAITLYVCSMSAGEKQLTFGFVVNNDPIAVATATSLGIVKGTEDVEENEGGINIEVDGSMWVNGWYALKTSVVNVISNLATHIADTVKHITSAERTTWNSKQDNIPTGTTAQYYRGDKSWQALDKSAVGLENVDNTSDASKPLSSAATTADNANVKKTGAQTIIGNKTFNPNNSGWSMITDNGITPMKLSSTSMGLLLRQSDMNVSLLLAEVGNINGSRAIVWRTSPDNGSSFISSNLAQSIPNITTFDYNTLRSFIPTTGISLSFKYAGTLGNINGNFICHCVNSNGSYLQGSAISYETGEVIGFQLNSSSLTINQLSKNFVGSNKIQTFTTPNLMASKMLTGETTAGGFYIASDVGGVSAGGYVGTISKVSDSILYYSFFSTDLTMKKAPICGNCPVNSTSWVKSNRSGVANITDQLYDLPTLAQLEATNAGVAIAYINSNGYQGLLNCVRISATNWYWSLTNTTGTRIGNITA